MAIRTFHCVTHKLSTNPAKNSAWVHQIGSQLSLDNANRKQRRILESTKTKKTPWWKSKP